MNRLPKWENEGEIWTTHTDNIFDIIVPLFAKRG